MSTREVLAEEWGPFFDAFSGARRGWLASLEVSGGGIGVRRAIHNLPLQGISADFEAGATRITILMGGSTEQHVTHTVSAPLHVWERHDEETGEDTLELETPEGVTLVRARRPRTQEAEASSDRRTVRGG